MAFSFADGFDLYATGTMAEAYNGYWDSSPGTNLAGPIAGRFAGSRAMQPGTQSTNPALVKASNVNDAVHHVVLAYYQTNAISGVANGFFITLRDGATAQCTITFQSNGNIVLTSGVSIGTVLATYVGAFSVTTTWYAFEFEVVINNTTGSFAVRKNGNPANDFTATGLNTRGGTANNYANAIGVGWYSTSNSYIDDFFWRSDATSVAWMGDLRCVTRMPVTDASVTFGVAGTRTQVGTGSTAYFTAAGTPSVYFPFVMTIAGSLVSISEFIYAFTGTVKCALFNDNGSNAPGTVIATSSTVVTNPTGVSYIFAFTGVTLAVGQKVWLGFCPSTASTNFVPFQNGLTPVVSATVSYASFPVANPTVNAVTAALTSPTAATFTITPINSSAVNDPQQDATTSYVYDSTPGDADFYNIGTIATSAPITLAVTTRGYMQKSDVGGRTAAVQIKSGATTVASPTLTLTTSGWQWAYRTDIVDPNTGSAWTAAAVAAAQVGPVTVS